MKLIRKITQFSDVGIVWRVQTRLHMDVSKNSGTPKSCILIGFSIITILGCPYFWKYPYLHQAVWLLPGFLKKPPTEAACPALKFSLWRRSAARPCERIPRRVTRARRFGEGSGWGGEFGIHWVLLWGQGVVTFKIFKKHIHLGVGFEHFLFSPGILGEDEPILTHIFSNGLVQPPTSHPQNLTPWKMMLGNWGKTHLSFLFGKPCFAFKAGCCRIKSHGSDSDGAG